MINQRKLIFSHSLILQGNNWEKGNSKNDFGIFIVIGLNNFTREVPKSGPLVLKGGSADPPDPPPPPATGLGNTTCNLCADKVYL